MCDIITVLQISENNVPEGSARHPSRARQKRCLSWKSPNPKAATTSRKKNLTSRCEDVCNLNESAVLTMSLTTYK